MNASEKFDRPKVSEVAKEILKEAVNQNPRAVSENSSVWDCNQLANYLEKKGCAKVSRETVKRHLHHLNFRVVRPVLSGKSPDPKYTVKAEKLSELQEQAERGEIILLYQDEVEMTRLPGLIGGWTERGKQLKVPTPRTIKNGAGLAR